MKGAIRAKPNTRVLKSARYQKEWPKKIIGLLSAIAKIFLSAFFFSDCKWLNILTHMADTTLQ